LVALVALVQKDAGLIFACYNRAQSSHTPRVGDHSESAMAPNPVPANLGLSINRQATDAIVRCTGRITSDTTQSLKATVKPLFSESKRVLLDLTDVNHLDSSGLGAIIGLYVSAKFANCHLKVTYSNESLKKLFSITRLDQLLAEGA
jgi:anti-sigma B factor antagonist